MTPDDRLQLHGAMGVASLGARLAMAGYASAPLHDLVVRDGQLQSEVGARVPHEVGITDVVMAVLCSLGPIGASVSVSSVAEARQVGADLGFVDESLGRILLFQAKVGSRGENNRLILKSRVAHQHLRLLEQREITVDGRRYQVAGRLAVYQSDLHACHGGPGLHPRRNSIDRGLWWRMHDMPWWWQDAGRYWYERHTRSDESACGILAAPVTSGSFVQAEDLVPWEFLAGEWLGLDTPPGRIGKAVMNGLRPETSGARPSAGDYADLMDEDYAASADAFFGALGYASSTRQLRFLFLD